MAQITNEKYYQSKRQKMNNDGLSDKEEDSDDEDEDLDLFKKGGGVKKESAAADSTLKHMAASVPAQAPAKVKSEEAKQNSAPPKEPQSDPVVDNPLFKIEKESDGEPLSSDPDDESAEEDEDYKDRIVAQYEKVQRTKHKYKCQFKDVIMQIEGKEYVLKRLQAEIDY